MQQYTVTGMTCAACSARVEQAVGALEGVDSCAVSLLTNSMTVEGSVAPATVLAAVERAGYHAAPKGEAVKPSPAIQGERQSVARRLVFSLIFLAVLMYLSMGHTMWGWPLPTFLAGNPVAIGLTQLLLATVVLVFNRGFFLRGAKGLLRGAPNMDTLVALGSAAAYGYSLWELYDMTAALSRGDAAAAIAGLRGLYFESAAMILTLITVGKLLEARAKGRTTDALQGLMALSPRMATVLADGEERMVPVEQVTVGCEFIVRPGDAVPVDGIVLEGRSAVNEAALTGESLPIDKKEGDSVSAATVNQAGYLRCRATRVGEDTTLSQIIRLVEQASSTKAPIAKTADRVSRVFVPVVLGLAMVTAVGWLLAGQTAGYALSRGMAVLVISCPCALGLATPVAIMVGSGVGARHGVLFKTAASLEQAGRTKIVVMDKTGTLTEGQPRVTDCLPIAREDELLAVAYGLESRSEHPLGAAVCRLAQEKGIQPAPLTEFSALPGQGLTARMGEHLLAGGNGEFIRQKATIPESVEEQAAAWAQEGKTPLFFSAGDRLLGVLAVADTLRADSRQAVQELKSMGIRVVMLTGDNPRTAAAIGRQAGVEDIIAGVLPQEKEAAIARLREQGPTTMVGDGINDAPALTRADVGIAIGAGTDVAMDAADVVLMHSRPSDVPAAIRLSRATLRNVRQNLFWAFVYNMVGIPLAAGVFSGWLGWDLNPMFGAAAMSLSSFGVVSNALRLNLFRFQRTGETITEKREEQQKMEKTLRIEGMICPHCEAHVKRALEALEGVASVVASHEAGTAVITLTADVPDELLKETVEKQGYTVCQ